MTRLRDLQDRWFVDLPDSRVTFPRQGRHPGSSIGRHTEGSTLEVLMDGEAYMSRWLALVRRCTAARGEIMHASFTMNNVRTGGQSRPGTEAIDALIAAKRARASVYVMLASVFFNRAPAIELLDEYIPVVLDDRLPGWVFTSRHSKLTVFKAGGEAWAMIGSIDLAEGRWDDMRHLPSNAERPRGTRPTHDIGVLVRGPAVADLERAFRDSWNDSSRPTWTTNTQRPIPLIPVNIVRIPDITTPIARPAPVGPLSIQMLLTYGRTRLPPQHTWGPTGEFSVWLAYVNAIRQAQRYIYIECQYLLPFVTAAGTPCFLLRPGPARDSDPVYNLGEALRHGVAVVIVVPDLPEEPPPLNLIQRAYRDTGIAYLQRIAADPAVRARGGRLHVFYPVNSARSYFVHAKLMVCDDAALYFGSANFNQRSLTHDTEVHFGVVDGTDRFVPEFRLKQWAHHSGLDEGLLRDWRLGLDRWVASARARTGRSREYAISPALINRWLGINRTALQGMITDPYAGPPR